MHEYRATTTWRRTSADFTYDSNRTVEISREKSPWPKNNGAADAIWAARIEENLLRERLRADEVAAKASGLARLLED